MDEGSHVGPERAVEALRWAAAQVTAGDPARGAAPPKPTPAEHRALPAALAREHLDSLLVSGHAETGLDALQATGMLDVWLPEVASLVGFGDGEWRHKDVWKHTKQVVRQAVPRLAVRWGALLHDVGKPKTRRIEPTGEVHFFGHAEVGAAMFRKRIATRLGLDGPLGERVHYLILHHLRASQYDETWTDSAVRRFAREMGDGLTDLLDLSRADITTKRPHRRKQGLRLISELAERIRSVQELDARIPALPKGLGTAIAAAFGIPPSRRIGDIKCELEARCEAGTLDPGKDSEFYVEYLRRHADELDL